MYLYLHLYLYLYLYPVLLPPARTLLLLPSSPFVHIYPVHQPYTNKIILYFMAVPSLIYPATTCTQLLTWPVCLLHLRLPGLRSGSIGSVYRTEYIQCYCVSFTFCLCCIPWQWLVVTIQYINWMTSPPQYMYWPQYLCGSQYRRSTMFMGY